MEEVATLYDTEWQVEDIDGGGIIDSSHITMQLSREGGLSGSAGCNRYTGLVDVDSDVFVVKSIASTRRACAPALMQQEQRLLSALKDVRRHAMDGDHMHLYDELEVSRVRMIRTSKPSEAMSTEQAQNRIEPEVQRPTRFSCTNGPNFDSQFVGPETVTLKLPDGEHILQRERAASGAKYTGSGIVFWNKGSEALLEIDGIASQCLEVGL